MYFESLLYNFLVYRKNLESRRLRLRDPIFLCFLLQSYEYFVGETSKAIRFNIILQLSSDT